MVANASLIINEIKAVFYKNWCQKAGILIENLLCVTKMSTIEEYPMVCANFDSLASSFQIFIVSRLRRYALDLGLGFISTIVKVTGKVIKRKISLAKL